MVSSGARKRNAAIPCQRPTLPVADSHAAAAASGRGQVEVGLVGAAGGDVELLLAIDLIVAARDPRHALVARRRLFAAGVLLDELGEADLVSADHGPRRVAAD